MRSAVAESPWPLLSSLGVMVPTALPITSAASTKASQPAIALPRWRVLQRPIRAASDRECAIAGRPSAESPDLLGPGAGAWEEVRGGSIVGPPVRRHAGPWRLRV